jgi:hypothetical protein
VFSPFPAREGGKFGWVLRTGERLTPKRRQTLSLRGWANLGVQGASPPGGGGGCPPTNSKGGELPTLSTCPRVGPNTLANHQPTRVGKFGGPGGFAPWRGRGVSPHKFKRGRVAHLINLPTSGAQYTGEPSAHEGGQTWGSRGLRPLAWAGGVPPQIQKGASCPHYQPAHEWGPIRWRTLNPRGWANLGVQGGEAPMAGGCGGCPPTPQNKGQVAHSYIPATGRTQNAGEP